ncbi:MAG: hypothetical protein AB3N11_04805, partial [Arenibacterium sp.]
RDFTDDVDQLLLHSRLWDGNRSVNDLLNDFGKITNFGAVLDFGSGDVVRLKGIDDLAVLQDDILIL